MHASKKGAKQQFQADLVVHGAGRIPDIEDLDLDKAGVEYDKRGSHHQRDRKAYRIRSLRRRRCAAGWAPSTPVASMEGRVAAANLLDSNRHKPNYTGVSTAVFTIPPIASVGLQENTAKAQGLNFKVNHCDNSGWYSSRKVGINYSEYKVLVEKGSKRILGAHLLGVHAEETINLFAMAMRFGLTTE